jgi:hypothetical protein
VTRFRRISLAPVALVGLAVALAACGDTTTAPTVADGSPTDHGTGTREPAATDGGTDDGTDGGTTSASRGDSGRSLTDEELAELEQNGGVVLADAALSDGAVAAVGYPDGDALGVELVGVPRDLLQGGSFGGSGELLLPGDTCNFQTVDEGFTVVVTDEPGVTVTVVGPDDRAVEEARPATVGDREVGVVLVEVGHTQDSPRPWVGAGTEC